MTGAILKVMGCICNMVRPQLHSVVNAKSVGNFEQDMKRPFSGQTKKAGEKLK